MLVHGRWFSLGTPASSTTKTGHRDIAEILLKVALNIINQSIQQCCMVLYFITMTKCSTADRTYCDTVCHWFPVHSHPPGTTVYPPLLLPNKTDCHNITEIFTGVKLMTITVITVIPRWRTWNQVRIFFVD